MTATSPTPGQAWQPSSLGTPDRPSTGHLFSSVTVPLISSPQFRGQPEENMIVRVVRFHRQITRRSNGKCMDELVSTCSTNEYFSFVDTFRSNHGNCSKTLLSLNPPTRP